MSAKTSGILATMLVLIIVARTPDEIPLFALGTDPITELALGLRNNPIPNPTTASHTAITRYGVFRSNPKRKNNPAEATSRPTVLNPLAPHSSKIHQLTGPL